MKKHIKIKFVDWWTDKVDANIFMQILNENYDVEVCEDADYVFFSVFGLNHWSVPNSCVKIFFTGENVCPDFNACDYAVAFERMDFGDRYFRLPNYWATPFFQRTAVIAETKHIIPDDFSLAKDKPSFCSFVVSNGNGNPLRQEMFEILTKYKQVDSGGRFMNNVGGPVADKFEFESRHKFSIAFENSSHPGYSTEKIVEAFAARTVPIYWGDPCATEIFNPKAFVNVHNFNSLLEVVDYVKHLDADDEAYMKMLQEPAFLKPEYNLKTQTSRLSTFLQDIIEQPLDKAYRRNREFWGQKYVDRELNLIAESEKSLKQRIIERYFHWKK